MNTYEQQIINFHKQSGRSAAVLRGLRQGLSRLVTLIDRWQERAESRRELARMPEAILKDIGVSRADAAREVGKPFWKQ
jgi:uncharacterized protein YjiS (DUF1127 family)